MKPRGEEEFITFIENPQGFGNSLLGDLNLDPFHI